MRRSKTAAPGVVTAPSVASRLRALLVPPDGLLARLRWSFLLLSILMSVLAGSLVLQTEITPFWLRATALAGLLALVWWWIRGYARGRFPLGGIAFEGTAVFAAALATGAPPTALGLFYGSLLFRSLYGPLRGVVLLLLAYLAAFYGSVALASSLAYLGFPLGAVLLEALGLPLVAFTLHALATTVGEREQLVFREQTLRMTSAALVETPDRDGIYAAVLGGAQALAREVPGTRASVAIGTPERMTVVASAGDGAAEAKGACFDLRRLPEGIREPVLRGTSVEVRGADPAAVRAALGFEPKVGSVYYVPLMMEGELGGLLVLASDGALDPAVRGSLDILGSGATLALENASRTEEVSRRKGEERFSALIQNVSDVVTVVDAEGKILYQSPSGERVFGHKPDEVVGTRMTESIHPDDVERVWAVFADILGKPGATPAVEVRARHRDGSWRHVEAVANNLLHDPDLRGIVVNSRDVTERKRAEEALKESEASLVAAQRLAGLGSWDTGPLDDRKFDLQTEIRWSDEMYRILGHAPGSFVPTMGSLLDAIHPEDFERVGEEVHRSALEQERRVEVEHRILRPDGEVRTVRARIETWYGKDGEPTRRYGAMLDVTETKTVEDALRRREAELAAAQRIAHVGNWVFEVDRDEARWSDEMYRIFGYEPQEFRVGYKRFMRMVHPDDREKLRGAVREALYGEEGIYDLDCRLVRADGEVRFLRARYETVRDAEGRPLRLIGTAHDITEQQRAEEALKESERRYRTLVEQTPAVTYIEAPDEEEGGLDHNILYVSPQIEELLGYTQQEWTTDPDLFADTLHPDEREWVLAEDERTKQTGEPFRIEYRLLAKDGSVVWLRDEAVLVRGEGGEPLYWQGVMYDITEGKRSEEERGRLAAIVESSEDAIFSCTLDGTITTWNGGAERLYGYPAEEMIGRSVFVVTAPERSDQVRWSLESIGRGEHLESRETVHLTREGARVDVSLTLSPIRRAGGDVVGVAVIARDVGERKRAERALRESEERFRNVVEQAADALFIHDLEGNLVDVNRRACENLGYAKEELLRMTVTDIEENFDPTYLARLWHRMVSGESVTLDGVHRRKDGTTFPVEVRIGPFQAGASRLVLGVVRDVTERKLAEEELRRSERGLATAQRIARIGSWELDVVTGEQRWSDETYRILGRDPHSFTPTLEHFMAHVHPEDRQSFREYAENLPEGPQSEGMEHRIVRPDGEVRIVYNRREVERDEAHKPIRAMGTVQDVTEQREAQQRLLEAERKYRTLIEQLPAVTYIQDIESNALSYASPQLESVLGYTPEEYLADPALFAQTIHPDDREWVLAEDARTDMTGEPYAVECRRIRKDDSLVWVRDEAMLVRDAEGEPLFWQGILTDITERKEAEEALRQSEERYRAVVEQAVEGIYLVDLDTKRILESNPAFRRLLGYAAEELPGTTLYDIVAHDPESVDSFVRRILEEGSYQIGERRHRRADGTLVDVDVSVSLIAYGGRDVLSCVAHDITERKRAERALRESEEMFRAVFDSAATGVVLTDLDGRFVRVNAALEQLLGYEADELRERTVMDLTHPEDVELTVDAMRRLLSGEIDLFRMERRYIRKDGTLLWAHATVSAIRDADGGIRYVLGLLDDVTERKRVEEEIRELNEDLERRVAERTRQLEATIADLEQTQGALRRSEERNRVIVETAPDAIITATEDGLVRSFNPGAERMFGYAAEEMVGSFVGTLMPERFRGTQEGGIGRYLEAGAAHVVGGGPVELVGLRKDGTEFPLELALAEAFEEGRKLFTGIVRDITERKEAEERLARAEQRYRALVERMPAVVYLQEIGSPDSAVYMSPRIEDLTGYTPEDCKDPSLRWGMVHPEDRGRLHAPDEDGEPGQVSAHEYRLLRRDGRVVWVRNESVVIEDEASGSRYWQGFMVDITERKEAEANLRAYAEKLRQSNRELQDFAYVASHDLQEPLRKVAAFGDRLKTKYAETLGEQGLDYLRRMEGATLRMQGLIEDLLSLSRVTTQASPFERVDLAELVAEVVSDLEARVEETGGTIEIGDLPTIEADRAQMRQLFQNLIGNALKFRKPGEAPLVEVRAEVFQERRNGERAKVPFGDEFCRITVEDNGIGFDEDHLERIFVPFERLHGRNIYEGTGMGLAICRKVVERHGGEITAKSAPGQGALFTITLPLKQSTARRGGEG